MHKISLAVLALVSNTRAQEFTESPHMITLHKDNFEQMKKDNPMMLINFYSSWCPFSQMLMPIWHEAATMAKEKAPLVKFAQVKCDSEEAKQLCQDAEIDHYPDMQIWSDGEMEEVEIARTTKGIVSWAFKHSTPPVQEVDCYQLQEELKEEALDFGLVHFGDNTASSFTSMFEPFAKQEIDMQNIKFFNVKDRSCAVGMGASAETTVLMHRSSKDFSEDKKLVIYSGPEKITDLSTWAKTHFVPPILEIDEEHDELILSQNSPVVILFRDEKDIDAPFMKEFEKAAFKNEGKIVFSYASGKKSQYQKIVQQFLEVKDEEMPILTALRPNERIRYHSPVDPEFLSEDFITRWVDSVISRKEKPWVRSEAAIDDGGPITHIVGENHDTVTKDPTKDVFVDYYAPWCGHCQRFEPTLKQLAYYFQYDKDLLISNFDCTKNEVVGDWIKAFPTFYFYPKGEDSKPIAYNGDRSFEAMKNWLFEVSTALKNRDAPVKEDL